MDVVNDIRITRVRRGDKIVVVHREDEHDERVLYEGSEDETMAFIEGLMAGMNMMNSIHTGPVEGSA